MNKLKLKCDSWRINVVKIKVAAVPPAFVSRLTMNTTQVLQKDKTKHFRTGSVGQAMQF